MDEQFSVKFIGDASSLTAASNQSASSLDKVSKASTNTAQSLGKTSSAISQAAGRMASSAATAGGVVAKTTKDFTGLSRVIQDLPFGFVAISNNLTQLLPAAGAAGLAFSAIVAGITFASTGLSNWTRGLIGSKSGVEDNTLALGLFGKELEQIKEDLDNFTSSLDYANKIGKLQIDIGFGKGLKSDLIDLRGQSIGNLGLTDELEKESKKVGEIVGKIRESLIAELVKPGNDKFFDAFDKGVLGSVDDLPEKVSKIFGKLTDAEKQYNDITGQLVKARQNQNVLYAQIEQKKIDIQEDAAKKADEAARKALQDSKKRSQEDKQNLQKYLEERARIIAQFSKDFAAIKIFSLPDVGDPPDNGELQKRFQASFDKAMDNFIFHIKPHFEVDQKELEAEFKKRLNEISKRISNQSSITNQTDQRPKENLEDFKKLGEDIGRIMGEGFSDVFGEIFEQAMTDAMARGLSGKQLENFKAEFASVAVLASEGFSGLGDAFGSMTEAILRGENAMKGFGDSLKNTFIQIAAQLIKTIVLAGILSAITGGASGGGLSFIGAFSKLISGSHATGLWSVPKDNYVANLHKGEMILPASVAQQFRSLQLTTPAFGKLNLPSTPSINVPGISHNSVIKGVDSVQAVSQVQQVPYIAGFDISHDKVRLMLQRANNYGNTFGR